MKQPPPNRLVTDAPCSRVAEARSQRGPLVAFWLRHAIWRRGTLGWTTVWPFDTCGPEMVGLLPMLPLAFSYMLSYLFRNVNGVVAPDIMRDLGVGAGSLGLLTSRLANSDLDLTIYYEAKVNLSFDQLVLLSRSGVKKVQFGIETFDTALLHRMRKGVTMLQNVEVLKLSAEAGIYVEWLALSGIPGETAEHYDGLAALLPKLTHLQAPGAFIRARADRFSPYAEAPERHGVRLEPLSAYRHLFPFDDTAIAALANHFTMHSPALEQHDAYTAPAAAAYSDWRLRQGESALWYEEAGPDGIVVHDLRCGRGASVVTLCDAAAALMRTCWRITRWRDIVDALGGDYAEGELASVAAHLVADALMLNEGTRWLTLALRQPGLRAAPSWEQVRRQDPVPYALRDGVQNPQEAHSYGG